MGCGHFQALGYRAPEVMLGLLLDKAVDMWDLCSVLAFPYIGLHLYSTHCEYEAVRVIVKMQGQSKDHVLNSGIRMKNIFMFLRNSLETAWRLLH